MINHTRDTNYELVEIGFKHLGVTAPKVLEAIVPMYKLNMWQRVLSTRNSKALLNVAARKKGVTLTKELWGTIYDEYSKMFKPPADLKRI